MTRPLKTPLRKRQQAKRQRIIAAYRADPEASQTDLARRFGTSQGRVSVILGEAGARDPERRAKAMQRQWREGRFELHSTGRPPVWPDVPEHLREDYDRLRLRYGYRAAEARAMLEPQA